MARKGVLMLQIHPQARTTPAVRAEIARSTEKTSVLKGKSPNTVVTERLKAAPELANPCYKPPPTDALEKAMIIAEHAKEVSQPDNSTVA